MHITPLQDSFNRGELSPKLFGQVTAEYYLDGVKTLTNFVAVPRGAVKRRTGFRYLNRVAIPNTTKNVFPQTAKVEIETPAVTVVT